MAVALLEEGAPESDVLKLSAAATKWWQRDNIPPEWWSAVIATPAAKGCGVNADLMVKLAARETAEART